MTITPILDQTPEPKREDHQDQDVLENPSDLYDPLEAAMKRHPALTRERAEELAAAFGF